MTESLLALVPTYGVWLIFFCLMLSCLALPLPSSIMVMAAGGFAAAGDVALWQVQLAALTGFIAGDQLTYGIARGPGQGLVRKMQRYPRFEKPFQKAEVMLHQRGAGAVFLTRTIFSPLGPYLGYLSGAVKLQWPKFTSAAIAGAVCWSFAYSLLGYFFAPRIRQIASMIGNGIGVIMLLAVAAALVWYLVQQWRKSQAETGQDETN